ncbi:glycosyltransferase family 2 protein [Paenibacillus ihbetae]|uniref:Glycosyltransferase 2-like domain-containing protein n=1 Tax=Paenibacillus ihbetae TaxID=1870820 RepID=A0ABX3K2N2_9BACL|nr:glycosyltransferase family 2 protein [Paenibacillus ihbetae]OOC63687.1 hypothetical protein BBD40_18625 [Paenibacillus ihbetae]
MDLEVILVTFNSEKWIEKCISSLMLSENIPLKKISITIVDNNSTDSTRKILHSIEQRYSLRFGSFNMVLLDSNLGFGAANNIGIKNSKSELCLLLNIDTEVLPNSLKELMNVVLKSDTDVGMWEMRQVPYEHPKIYNPLNRETTWCSAAACLVRKKFFELAGGFDENIFMYGEDVDLSWRIRHHGYKLIYVPESVVIHHTSNNISDKNKLFKKNSMVKSNMYLRFKYGSMLTLAEGGIYYALYIVKVFVSKKFDLACQLIRYIFSLMKLRQVKGRYKLSFKPSFYTWDYEISKEDGGYYTTWKRNESPLVSVIIRTIGKVELLRESLKSLSLQSYTHFEVVLVEDGSNKCENIDQEFPELNITYISVDQNVGRTRAGNIGLRHARGEYINFLDEDDLLFADHLEILVTQLVMNGDYKIAYTLSLEAPLEPKPFWSQFSKKKELFHLQYDHSYDRIRLLKGNFFPIQAVMFSREVYQLLGGFDETLNELEDWDLWLRYSQKYNFLYIAKVTSIYRVPFSVSEYSKRKLLLLKNHHLVSEKHSKTLPLNKNAIKIDKRDGIFSLLGKKVKAKQYKYLLLKVKRYIYMSLLKIKIIKVKGANDNG